MVQEFGARQQSLMSGVGPLSLAAACYLFVFIQAYRPGCIAQDVLSEACRLARVIRRSRCLRRCRVRGLRKFPCTGADGELLRVAAGYPHLPQRARTGSPVSADSRIFSLRT